MPGLESEREGLFDEGRIFFSNLKILYLAVVCGDRIMARWPALQAEDFKSCSPTIWPSPSDTATSTIVGSQGSHLLALS